MNSPFAMNHIPLFSLIMPQLVESDPVQQSVWKCRLLKWGHFVQGGMNLQIYVFRLTHSINTILFRHLRYDVITWKREGSKGQRRIPLTKG